MHCTKALNTSSQGFALQNTDSAPEPAQEHAQVWVGDAPLGSSRAAVTPTNKAHDNLQSQQAFSQHGVTSHEPRNATGSDDKKLFV